MTELIGDGTNSSIHIDESAFPKSGLDSVGVKRQYCGRLGKVENCQVGVFLGYTNGLLGDELWLIIRRGDDESSIKYQFSNAPKGTSVERFAWMSCSRYWIERTFEDAKGIAGLSDYHVRSWTRWHHHIMMSLLAMLTILMLTIDLGKKAQLLTVQDVKEILEEILPKRDIAEMEILNLIEGKHKARYFFKLQEWVYEAAIHLIWRVSHIIVNG